MRRTRRAPRALGPSPDELAWLTGEPQPGSNRFWHFAPNAERIERCRALLVEHADLIPPARRVLLEKDLRHWATVARLKRKNASAA